MQKSWLVLLFLAMMMAAAVASKVPDDVTGFTVSGVRIGMSRADVVKLLGRPAHEGAGWSFFEEQLDALPDIGWWLDYETGCGTARTPHQRPHVGLDQRDGKVVFVAGPSLERDGLQLLVRDTTQKNVEAVLGTPDRSWSGDACYHEYKGIVVRGCGDTASRYTYYLRDWTAVDRREEARAREEIPRELARRHVFPRTGPPRPAPRGALTMLGIYLGMTLADLKNLGLPMSDLEPTAGQRTASCEVGDLRGPFPPTNAGCVLYHERVVLMAGSRVDREGSALIACGYTQTQVEQALGPPARTCLYADGRALLYPEWLLTVSVDGRARVQGITIGARPETAGSYHPSGGEFTPAEIQKVLAP